MGDVVTAEAVQIKLKDGSYAHLYKDAPLPDNIDPKVRQHLLDSGLAAEVAAPDSDDAGDGKPAKSANKAEWVAYAVSQGLSEADANAASKEDLIALHS